MVIWLRTVSAQAMKRAMQATAQADSYSLAMATTPPSGDRAEPRHTWLEATNFFWVNTIPIALNEADYFIRMWNQAAGAMDVYQAETMLNLMFEMIAPPKPVVVPGAAAGIAGAAIGKAAAMAPAAAVRNAAIAQVGAQAAMESVALEAGRAGGNGQHGRPARRRPGPEGGQCGPAGGQPRPILQRHADGHADELPNSARRSANFRSRPARWSCSRCSS